MSDKTKLAKAHGLLADAHSELCGLMNAMQYDGMKPDVAGAWFAKVRGMLDKACAEYGVPTSDMPMKKMMTQQEFTLHAASEVAKAKLESPAVGRQRLEVLKQALAVAGQPTAEGLISVPLFTAPAQKDEAPAAPAPAPAAPAATTVTDPVADPKPADASATPSADQITQALDVLAKRVSALDVIAAQVDRLTKAVGSIDDMMDAETWPDDMSSEVALRGDDPQDAIAKSEDGFGLDPGFSAPSPA